MELRPTGEGKVSVRINTSLGTRDNLRIVNNVLCDYYRSWMRKNVRPNMDLKFRFLGFASIGKQIYAVYQATTEKVHG